MFDVRSLLDELLREDPRPERQTPTLGQEDRARMPATPAPVEPQSAPALAADPTASAELRPFDLLAPKGERRPLGATAPALAQTPHPAGDDPARKVSSLEQELCRLMAKADFAPEAAPGPTADGGLGDLLGRSRVSPRRWRSPFRFGADPQPSGRGCARGEQPARRGDGGLEGLGPCT